MRPSHPIFTIGGGVFKSRQYIPKVVDFFNAHKGKNLKVLENFPINVEMFKKPAHVHKGDMVKILDYIQFNGIAEFSAVEDYVLLEYNGEKYHVDASIAYTLIVGDSDVREAIASKLERIKASAKVEEERKEESEEDKANRIPHFSPFMDGSCAANTEDFLSDMFDLNEKSNTYFMDRGKALAEAVHGSYSNE